MAGTGGRLGRIAAIVAALAIGLLLLAARGAAGAGYYTVVQCGWGAGLDASWVVTAAAAALLPDPSCPQVGTDEVADTHVGITSPGHAGGVAAGSYAAWRWVAPEGAGIVAISGNWWRSVQSGFEQQLATESGDGTLAVFAAAADSDTSPTPFAASFPTPRPAFEDLLRCARKAGESCFLNSPTSSAVDELTIRVEDLAVPLVGIGGDLVAGGWRRGVQGAVASGSDAGSGLRFAELRIDGLGAAQTELPCAKTDLDGWVATQMRPCQAEAGTALALDTTSLGDGPHTAAACLTDFAENLSCTPDRRVLVNNNPPAAPRGVVVAGGWGRSGAGEFDVSWTDPDQERGSTVAAALWRVTGPDGYDTGVKETEERGIAALERVTVPCAGNFTLHLWLGDEAGNSLPANAVAVALRDGARAGRPSPGGGGAQGHRGGPGHHGGGPGESGVGARVRLQVHLRSVSASASTDAGTSAGRGGRRGRRAAGPAAR